MGAVWPQRAVHVDVWAYHITRVSTQLQKGKGEEKEKGKVRY